MGFKKMMGQVGGFPWACVDWLVGLRRGGNRSGFDGFADRSQTLKQEFMGRFRVLCFYMKGVF